MVSSKNGKRTLRVNGYSRKAGDSIYPIKEGTVFKLKKKQKVNNKKLNIRAEHDCYIWIQRVSTRKTKRQPKNRMVKILMLKTPAIVGLQDKYIIWENLIEFRNITAYLRDGYEVLATNIRFEYKKRDYEAFYKLVGLL